MFKALVWKEWRQLALVRWGGIALGALLPVAFNTGAELSRRGLLPTGKIDGHPARDLLFEVLPVTLALSLWPLIALMSASQAFAGDRAAGTESFLLERPVPRAAVWRARLAAAAGTIGLVVVTTAVLGMAVAALAGAPAGSGWSRWLQCLAGGSAVALLAFLGGVLAASLLSSPMAAVLGGLLLAGLPALLGAELASMFPFAALAQVPIGMVLPLLLVPAYVAASWSAASRGEPAGRGRVRRGTTIVVASIAGVVVLFAILAPVAVRATASSGLHGVLGDSRGRRAFVGGGGSGSAGDGGWIVDPASGRRIAFIPPPVRAAAWSPDGAQLAVVTWSAAFGGQSRQPRLDVFRAEDGRAARSIALPELMVSGLVWASDGIVLVTHRIDGKSRGGASIEVVDPTAGERRSTGFTSSNWGFLEGPRADGRVYFRVPIFREVADGKPTYDGFELRPIDVRAAKVGAPLTDLSGRVIHFGGWVAGLSPSGRYALVADEDGRRGLLRVKSMDRPDDPAAVAIPRSAKWLDGDRLVWHETSDARTRLFTMVPGEPPVALREWMDAQVGIETDPGRASIFVSVLPAGGAPAVDPLLSPPDPARFASTVPTGAVPEEGIVPAAAGVWTALPVFSGRQSDQRYTLWAGPETLARIAPGVVCFVAADGRGPSRCALGSERDLR